MALSEIIDVLNERFGTEFTKADQLISRLYKEIRRDGSHALSSH